MGNETSKSDNKGRIITISAPQGGLQMVPTPERDPQGAPVRHRDFDINRANLLVAFQHMAEYLQSQNADVTVVAVGGAVNTIYLQNREVTHDVDFFGGNEQSRLLKDASKYAQQESKIQLGANWLNNATTLFIPLALQARIIQAAMQQNVVLFREKGFTVLAAPWDYAFCGKTNRMGGPDERPYDCKDAVGYLREYILSNGEKPVKAREIEEWGKIYGKMVTTCALKQISSSYEQAYGQDGIIF
uniref:DUF7582 domain-containing protein n=1 Tax=Coccidioides posadasii RMSCC 3488 TaxID=454284 RepID=A0A0J6FCU0_COCPO|nr:hypothetical protein CPAG_07180 [Coccidioides posadasii RMSCC 3488]